jgi:nitroreductase
MIESDAGEIVLQALATRRSMARVRPERPPRELVERVIGAAAWAPNHHKTEPWRFTVLAGTSREGLGAIMANALHARIEDDDDDLDPEEVAKLLEKERNKPLRAPVVIAVAAVPSAGPKVVEIEEIAATAAAVQNMLLAAEAVGLGAMWRTGKPAYDPAVLRFLEFPEHAHLVAFVYLGYPDLPPQRPRARSVEHYTTWKGWD